MILDKLAQLSLAQAVAATAVSTNVFDMGNVTPKRDIGIGEPLELHITVNVAADAVTGDETYEFQLVTDDDVAIGSPTVVEQLVVPRALLVVGFQFTVPLPQNRILERYLAARYVLGGTTPSITVTTYLQPRDMSSVQPKHHAKGYTN